MNARVVVATIGLLTLVFGIAGLTVPTTVMQWVGLAEYAPTTHQGAIEVRAVYGGAFTVLGAFTLWFATAPRAHRGELVLIAFLWLGLFGGRMVGVSIDGSPGLFNWLGAILELTVGCLLLAAAYLDAGEHVPVVATAPQA
jgi:Domain of unknown function (DUF4345)